MDLRCPWCGDLIDETDSREPLQVVDFERAMEAHVAECDAAQAEMGGDQS